MQTLALILDLILLFGFLASSLGLGAIILRQVGPSFVSPLERILFATGIGLAVFAYATAGLAAAGGLYPTVARTLYGFGLLIGIMQANRLVFPSLRSLSRLEVILITFLFTFAILALVGVLSPPTDWDSLMYHLEVPKRYIQAHGYVYIPNGYANFPQFIESLYAFAMLVHGDILARLVNLTFGGLATLTVYVVARRFAERSIGLLASLIFVSSPLVVFVFVEVFIEAGLTFYSLLALLALITWRANGDHRWFWLSVIMVGISLSIKYYTIILVPIFAWVLFERAWWMERRSLPEVLWLGVKAGLVISLFPLPWLIKNAIFIGDPVFPIISSFLGRWGRGIAQANWAYYGMGYDLLDYLLLPWRMTFGDRFGVPKPGPLFFILLPLLLGLPRAPGLIRWLGGVLFVWFIFWANSAGQSVRFFLPGLAVLSVVVAVTLASLPGWAKKFRPFFITVITTIVVYNLIWPIYFASWSLPYVTGQQSRHEYLMNSLDIYPVADYTHRNLPATAEIATVWEERGYYFDRPLVIGQSPDGAFLHQFVSGDDPVALAEAFLSRGLTHLIINHHLTNDSEFNLRDRYIYGVETQALLVHQSAFQSCFLRSLFEYEGIALYGKSPLNRDY
ncbi:MAG: glycosyltransferase family 39 protein [Anaerolineales bacterium]|nr:glycosyltransferase family 39 protein [Anaerolineales bacterium]